MTARKKPEDLKIRARDDMTVKPKKKRGVNATPEGKMARVEKLRKTAPNSSTLDGVALANPDRPLTEKQKLFVSLWAQGDSILGASHRAGYADAGTMAYRMSKDPAILKVYHKEKALYEQACDMTRKKVMDGLIEGIEMAKLMAEPASMIAGWREVGKMCGYYEPVKRTLDITVSGEVSVKRLEGMSDAALLQLIKGEVTEVEFTEVVEEEDE